MIAGSANYIFNGMSIIVTGFRLGRQELYQQLRTFANKFFTYSFGEKPGTITVSGVFFYSNGCSSGTADLIATINGAYESFRAWSNPGYQAVAIGGAAFRGMLVGLEVSAEAEDAGIGRFQFTFATIPQETT